MKRASAVETFQIKLLFKKQQKKKLLWQLYMIQKSTTLNLELKITCSNNREKSKIVFFFFFLIQISGVEFR